MQAKLNVVNVNYAIVRIIDKETMINVWMTIRDWGFTTPTMWIKQV